MVDAGALNDLKAASAFELYTLPKMYSKVRVWRLKKRSASARSLGALCARARIPPSIRRRHPRPRFPSRPELLLRFLRRALAHRARAQRREAVDPRAAGSLPPLGRQARGRGCAQAGDGITPPPPLPRCFLEAPRSCVH